MDHAPSRGENYPPQNDGNIQSTIIQSQNFPSLPPSPSSSSSSSLSSMPPFHDDNDTNQHKNTQKDKLSITLTPRSQHNMSINANRHFILDDNDSHHHEHQVPSQYSNKIMQQFDQSTRSRQSSGQSDQVNFEWDVLSPASPSKCNTFRNQNNDIQTNQRKEDSNLTPIVETHPFVNKVGIDEFGFDEQESMKESEYPDQENDGRKSAFSVPGVFANVPLPESELDSHLRSSHSETLSTSSRDYEKKEISLKIHTFKRTFQEEIVEKSFTKFSSELNFPKQHVVRLRFPLFFFFLIITLFFSSL